MNRERALKFVLVLVGLLFSAGIHPLAMSLWHPSPSEDTDDNTMMLSLYGALGISLLIAVRNPSANRSLIAFAAWSSLAHATVMTVQAFQFASERMEFLIGSAVRVVIAAVLIVLAARKQSTERVPAAAASCVP